jgi:hypothetical protein
MQNSICYRRPSRRRITRQEYIKSMGWNHRILYTLIVTAKMNDIDPQVWLADVLERLPDMPVLRVSELLPWKWKTAAQNVKAA